MYEKASAWFFCVHISDAFGPWFRPACLLSDIPANYKGVPRPADRFDLSSMFWVSKITSPGGVCEAS